jgi:hypothetical protein
MSLAGRLRSGALYGGLSSSGQHECAHRGDPRERVPEHDLDGNDSTAMIFAVQSFLPVAPVVETRVRMGA